METKRITEFKAGKDLFTSNGISKVKVTQDGVVECLEIPITSTGISDLIDTFQKKAPPPPLVNEKVTPDSEMGKQMKISQNTWIKMPDFSDPDYIKRKEDHDSDLGLAIVMKGLAVEIKDEDGNVIKNDDKKLKVLKGMGLTGDQFTQLVDDIQSLTKWTEEDEERFLD